MDKTDNTIKITDTQREYKSVINIGSVGVYVTRSFNAFQRKMWKLLLGVDIEQLKR